jgi:hypothetical protein
MIGNLLQQIQFSLALSATSAALAPSVFTPVPWDTVVFDPSSTLSAGVFTAPIAGKYQFSASVGFENAVVGDRVLITLYKNGVEFARGQDDGAGGTGLSRIFSGLLNLAAGDTVSMQAFTTGTTEQIVGSPAVSYFSGSFMG